MSWIFTIMGLVSVVAALWLGNGSALGQAIGTGAQAGITLGISMAGALCLWTGVGKLLEKCGFTAFLSKLLRPVLHVLFPDTKKDHRLAGILSANICANLLGLGNAATPMGLQAAAILGRTGCATDQLCRLIVLNTASIQLIPTTVAALRSSLGSSRPFDILPQVWITSLCSACVGLGACLLFGRVWKK